MLEDWLGFTSDQVTYLRFGVDADFFSFSDFPDDRPLIVSFGNDRDRDPESLYEALDLVLKRIPDAQALVQCDTSIPAPKGVKVIERVSHRHLRDIYRRSSLALIATRPNLHASGMTVALEAMATGRPVVITETPGMSDYVREGESGHLVPCGDVEGLASAAIAVLGSPGVASEMGAIGRRSVEDTFNTESMAKRISEIIS
ncbi:glycosyltransferase family 4 protein [Rhodococcus gordoniae]|uniref:glycosyltransferase family 4 protein n=1 Tax=Rhodococcus gordoniae TaxID=223392 RepID=UPI0020CCC608|nr:glycosyltransferase family 4 protein [Rhodococcus gordoniae]UTT48037.1 glycosyltransferase family 4 protein [Rhodococcus gordoniae]